MKKLTIFIFLFFAFLIGIQVVRSNEPLEVFEEPLLGAAGSLRISYATGDDANATGPAATWVGETFTTSESFSISDVAIKAFITGSPGTITFSIFNVFSQAGNTPNSTSTAISTGTVNGSAWTTDTAGDWGTDITMSGAILDANTKYALVVNQPAGMDYPNDKLTFRIKDVGAYTGGVLVNSINSGTTWVNNYTGADMMFKIYGVDVSTAAGDEIIIFE